MRLFTALSLNDDVRDALQAIMVFGDGGPAKVRWLAPKQLHITLRFIGDVSEQCCDDLDQSLNEISFSPFQLRITGVGVFGSTRSPRVLWAGVEAGDILIKLFNNISEIVDKKGISPDKRGFEPHITLARNRAGPVPGLERWLANNDQFSIQPFTCQDFVLYRSFLESGGARYEVIRRYPAKHAA